MEIPVAVGIMVFVIGLVQTCAGADKWQTARKSCSWLKASDLLEAKWLTFWGLLLVLVSASGFLFFSQGG